MISGIFPYFFIIRTLKPKIHNMQHSIKMLGQQADQTRGQIMIQQNVHNNGAMTTTGCLASLAAYTKQARMSSCVK